MTPAFNVKWKLEFKNDCTNIGYNRCEWDEENKEHLHVECPECGYTETAFCEDSDQVVASTWTTTAKTASGVVASTVVGQPATVTPINFQQPRQPMRPATPTYVAPKPARCGSCPVDAVK